MKSLIIDTHLNDINIYLFDDFNIIKEKHIRGEKYNSKYLLPAIKEVCHGNDYNQIIVVNGPGSFTGVRLGVTVAKTLAFTQNIPIKTISSLDLMNYSLDTENHICAISDGNGYFLGEYKNHIQIKDYYYLSNNDFKQFINNHLVNTNVTVDFYKVLKELEKHETQNPHSIKPLYIKLIGVENDKKN